MQRQRFWLYQRSGVFYLHDAVTGQRESLHTRSKREAEQIRITRNQMAAQPQLGWALAKACLSAQDPKVATRTWQHVMEEFCRRGKPQTQHRRRRAIKGRPLNLLQSRKLIETTADDLMVVLQTAGAMANATLRCLQNLAVGLGWLPWPILPNKLWPNVRPKRKRGITWEEHQCIIAAEQNSERRLYYELLWETGASQSDAALLEARKVNWSMRTMTYERQKTGEVAHLRIGERLAGLLKQLPQVGSLFPKLACSTSSARSAEFRRRCRLLKIDGVSLHSYRYAWAERAKSCGYPERWAQNALGHNSPAVHQAYAKQGLALCPPLDEYEQIQKANQVMPRQHVASQPLSSPVDSSGKAPAVEAQESLPQSHLLATTLHNPGDEHAPEPMLAYQGFARAEADLWEDHCISLCPTDRTE